MAVRPIPEGYHTVTAYLIVRNAVEAIEFYVKAFGATELMRMEMPSGKIGHAEIQIGDSRIMMADEAPEMGFQSPLALGGSPVAILLYVEDVNALYDQALAAGAKSVKPLADQFYGDRAGTLADPYGHVWTVATHVEDVSEEELNRRFAEMMQNECAE